MVQITATVPAVYEDEPFDEGVRHAAEAGVDAIEFFEWDRDELDQLKDIAQTHQVDIAGILLKNGMPSEEPAMTDPDQVDAAIEDLRDTIAAAAKLDCESIIVTVGPEQEAYSREVQHRAIVDVLRSIADEAERKDVTLGVEPLNASVDHPGYYLTSSREAYDIVEAVDSSSVSILFDVYHMQIAEGNVIDSISEYADRIDHYHVADVPGRHEPGTGELNYENVVRAIADTGFDGYIGCEFWPTDDPDATLEAAVELLRQ
ncbi:hydroxypyruvate isomerase family protein [Halalkalicoccus jeotgali]|uniref:hydroxypyruvate isomerase family protein n=1 Tax=Halalkalicoccus jeotgali TaxID=413810 RepID=UPI000B2C222D|nr:TIM barrel protein [Halalkalicoccus jeotgali]